MGGGRGEAEGRVRVEGGTEAESGYADPQATSRSRNEGETASAARLRLWAIREFIPNLQGFVLGALEGGSGTETGETDTRLEQAYLRYSFEPPNRLFNQTATTSLPTRMFRRRV